MELLVGITIGLLVVIAALGTLASTQLTSTTVGDSARLQQKADFIFRSMGFQLRQAGGIDIAPPAPVSDFVAYSTAFTGYGGVTSPNLVVTGVEGASSAADTLRVSYEEQVGVSRDCLGNFPIGTTATDRRVDNQFSIGTGANAGRLMCLGNGSATPQAIADGVEDFQVTYGVRTVTTPSPPIAPPSARVPDVANYREFKANTPAPFGTATTLNGVNSVTVCLQLRGDLRDDARRIAGVTGCGGTVVAADGFIRRVYRNTFLLRSTVL
jgi:type IV pilus assembly protein PilW